MFGDDDVVRTVVGGAEEGVVGGQHLALDVGTGVFLLVPQVAGNEVDQVAAVAVDREFIEVALEFDAVVFQREADALLVNPVQRDDLVVVWRGDGYRGRLQIAGVAHGQYLPAVGHARHQRHVVPLRRQRGRARHRVLEKTLGAGRLLGGRRQMAGRQQQGEYRDEYQGEYQGEYRAGHAGRSHGRSVAN